MKKIVLGLMLLGSVMFGDDREILKEFLNEYVPLLLKCEFVYDKYINKGFDMGGDIDELWKFVFSIAKGQEVCRKYVKKKHGMDFLTFVDKNIPSANIKKNPKQYAEILIEARKEFMPLYPNLNRAYFDFYLGYLLEEDLLRVIEQLKEEEKRNQNQKSK